MKKWLAILMGIFTICGGFLLSSCGKESASLTLSHESANIEIYSDEIGSGEQVVLAEVLGTSKYSLEASANGYDEFISVSTVKVSSSKTNIVIKGISENESPSMVTVRVAPGNIEKHIFVNVFSQIKQLEKNTDVETMRENFFVKGQTKEINADNLLKITPEKARRDITWSIDGAYPGASIEGNKLTLADNFRFSSIKLKPVTSKGVTTDSSIEVAVLDKIEEEVSFQWSYNQNSSFVNVGTDNEFLIVPNFDKDPYYNGFVTVDYLGDLSITGYAIDANGKETDSIVVNRHGSYNGKPLFKISGIQGRPNLNGQFKVGFKIGYSNYNYYYDTMTTCPININARETINNIIVSTDGIPDIDGSVQTLYTQYVDVAQSTSYGKEFNISMTPTTVIDATNKYSITVSRFKAGGSGSNGCPIEIWYRDEINGNRWTQIQMKEETATGNFVVMGDHPSVKTLYIKASENIIGQVVEDFRLTFGSDDNAKVETYFDLRLVRAATQDDFKFSDGDFRIDSSENKGNVVRKKQFTLTGQTSVDGLYIISNSEAVTFSDIQYVSNGINSVTFEVTLTLKGSAYGITTLDSYQIAHKNGLVSEEMDIDIFLPLKDVSIRHSTGDDQSNSVSYYEYSTNTYLLDGEVASSTMTSLSQLMLKKDTTTPVLYSYNSVNGNNAEAQISVGFVDFVEDANFDFADFKDLMKTKEGVASVIASAKENGNSSHIAYFTSDYSSIITKGEGHAYAVVFFTGKGIEGVDADGNVTFVRIVLLESFVSPVGMQIVPAADANVTLYSLDSLSSSDSQLTRKSIRIDFKNPNVTYRDIENFEFVSRSPEKMGVQNISGNTVTWENGRYSLSNVVVTGQGIRFNIDVIGTFGELDFYDTLDVHYVLRNDEGNKVLDLYAPISIAVKNAQRIEKLKWNNSDEDGVYFEVGDTAPKYLMLETSPANARNKKVYTVVDDAQSGVGNAFVSVNDEIASDVIALNLSSAIKRGMTGYVYLMPEDAVYNNQIRYYYLNNGVETQGIIDASMLGDLKDSSSGMTYYEFLVSEAYFKSNASDSNAIKDVDFAEILIRIKINVADGKSFEHSYRIFDNERFKAINGELFYTVMNSLDLTGDTYSSITSFKGGLQGYNSAITVKLDGDSFAQTIEETATIRNISFIGTVFGDGFVASVNKGTIQNVTVDVNGIYPSQLLMDSSSGGGIVDSNEGLISGASVLGLSILAGEDATIGGLAGINYGRIENSRVEFYNLAETATTYSANKFTAANVGAFVGRIAKGSQIYKTFAYNYTEDQEVLNAISLKGVFAATVADDALPTDTTIDYSFAFVGATEEYSGFVQGNSNVEITNYYVAYISQQGEYTVNYASDYQSNPNFISSGNGFESYVNNGYPHLKELVQDKKVDSVDYEVATHKDVNGYYKSLEVGNDQGIMFVYAIDNGVADLTSSEINDLNALNTISLASLLGVSEINRNIIVTSSDSTIIRVVGSSLRVLKTGEVNLTLSSKQNVELNKTIEINVVYSISHMKLSWLNTNGIENVVLDNSILTLQKTRSRDFTVGYEKTQVYLGQTISPYNLIENNIKLKINASPEVISNGVDYDIISTSAFKITAEDDSVVTIIEVMPEIFTESTLQGAINEVFARSFSINPIDGVIDFGISGKTLSITPSTRTTVKVEIKTTEETDSVYPIIKYNGEILKCETEGQRMKYILARDVADQKAILNADIEKLNVIENNGVYTITFNITFSVTDEYKANISDNMDFLISFESMSGNNSESWNGVFTLALTRQKFTNIDVQTRKISNSVFNSIDGKLVEVHTADKVVPALAPGNSAVMQVNINPTFAYFDYVDFSYTFNDTTIADAVNVEIVKLLAGTNDKFVRRDVDDRIETVGTNLRFTPTVEDKASGSIYYKLWLNTTLQKDSRIKFTMSFCKSDGTRLSYANAYITVSYLTQATISVDGSDTAYLAKGGSAEIRIDVLPDQQVDAVTIDGEDIKGLYISQLSDPIDDKEKGIRTYTATVWATIMSECENNMFSIQAQVSREINGEKEYKTSVATVILVDFKVSPDQTSISGAIDNNLVVWQGVPKVFDVDYSLIPEDYNVSSDEDSQAAYRDIQAKRDSFLQKGYYPIENAEEAKYLINYKYDKDLIPVKQTLKDRLFYVIGNERRSVFDESVESPIRFNFDEEENKMSVIGIKTSEKVELVLKTYVLTNGVCLEYDQYFTITVKVFSDADVPLKISNAEEFEALNPEGKTDVEINDYILTNDIVLENYSSFDTSAIRSLDGNGFTIYIKSFNTTSEGSATLNLALFRNVVSHSVEGKTVPTILKNIRVNLYNGGQITVNVDKYKTINVAGIAVENDGIITNCEVVSFYNPGLIQGASLPHFACTAHSNPTGINVNFVSGVNTGNKVFHDGYVEWTSKIAGFVVTNRGSITNSRVGGDEVILIENEKLIAGEQSGYTYAKKQKVDLFNIIGQGNMAGFVLENSGSIAASFTKNIDMENLSDSTSFYVAGFVGTNSNSIITSFVEGVESDQALLGNEYSPYAREGSSIKSKKGYISGFIYDNKGIIRDSYSNILITNAIIDNNIYLASGFVFRNEGNLENCYSASQIKDSLFTQLNFSGVLANGEPLTNGGYVNCYYFNKAYIAEDAIEDTTESKYSTGASLINMPNIASYFYGFAISSGETDGIWTIDDENGISLIEPNTISTSHRYVVYVASDFSGTAGEDENGKYILPYSTLIFANSATEINTSLGGRNNPILITDAQDWIDATGLSNSSYISEYFNERTIWGTYRIVDNIDMREIASTSETVSLVSSEKAFSGILYGNGFEISGISMTNSIRDVSFGMFASIEKLKDFEPVVTNLELNVEQIVAGETSMVGSLAGYIKDSNIINVKLNFSDASTVNGLNFVGALSGLTFGDNVIKNIVVENPTVVANRYSLEIDDDCVTTTTINDFRKTLQAGLNYNSTIESPFYKKIINYSYAGGLIGFVDNFNFDSFGFSFKQKDNFSINNVRVNGNVYVQGQIAGGAFGLIGYQTSIRDVGLIVEGTSTANTSKILSTKYYAGGLVGQSFGSISRSFASHQKKVQDLIEDNMSNFYNGDTKVERGILDLFYSTTANYSQYAIGGLVGLACSGNIEISYSKLNVTSPTANYAGGIFGGMDLVNTNLYQAESNLAYGLTYTKYFINEVYATGDIRANDYAGGIIGMIKGTNSKVAMLAVNAYNYFTTYNYSTNTYESLNDGQTNVSINFKVNSLVGSFIDNGGNIVPNSNVKVDDGTSDYLILMRSFAKQNGVTIPVPISSISVYQCYDFAGQKVKMNLFTANVDDLMVDLIKNSIVFVIANPSEYANSTTGHTYTQEGFLNSGAWSIDNWNHPMQELFPEIKYKTERNVLYLDCYNVREVFEQIKGSNARVIVRGQTSVGSERYADVNINDYLSKYEDIQNPTPDLYPKISDFAGRIEGGKYKVSNLDGSESENEVKIVASQNFIGTTAPGFQVESLTVEYISSQENISMQTGLFVDSQISESSISNLTIILDKNVVAQKPQDAQTSFDSFGIVSPKIISTNITNLTIVADLGNKSILSVAGYKESEINVGLVAGVLSQASEISVMRISNIKIETTSNLLALSNIESESINVGGYFGKVVLDNSNDKIPQDIRMTLNSLQKNADDKYTNITLNNVVSTVKVGGYFGYASGIGYLGTHNNVSINSNIMFDIQNSTISDLYVGGIMGVSANPYLSIEGNSSIIDTKLLISSNSTITNLYSGGAVGAISNARLALANFNTINLFIANKDVNKDNYPNQNSFAGNYAGVCAVAVSEIAYVGVVAGHASSQFEFVGKTDGSTTSLNTSCQPIYIQGQTYFGSVLGYTSFASDSSDTAKISGNILSKAQVVVKNSANTENVLGGMIGEIAGVENVKATANIGEEASKIRFDGAFYTNAKKVIAGGMLGKISSSETTSTLSIKNTSFGGVVKVFGENSNASDVTFGGSLGANASAYVEISENYNYGDAFVEYDDSILKGLETYSFGGLIGLVSISGSYNVHTNYSITTSHNARMSSVQNRNINVNALFGDGVPSSGIGDNYYNHAVALCKDEYGIDAGYYLGYDPDRGQDAIDNPQIGYYGKKESNKTIALTTAIKNFIGEALSAGHKLNPSEQESGVLKTDGVSPFNGITYYQASSLTNKSLSYNGSLSLENIGIIGNGNTIQYSLTSSEVYNGYIDTLSGYSFTSGFAMNVNVVTENSSGAHGSLVGTMTDNSIVYAINVYGSMEFGGTSTDGTYIGGLVGGMYAGRIFDCSTDLDIVYRGGTNAAIRGLTASYYTSTQNKFIDNCYVAGSLETMQKVRFISPLTEGGGMTINNCYSIAKVSGDDYTSSTKYTPEVSVLHNGDNTIQNVYIDVDGLNSTLGNSVNSKVGKLSYSDFTISKFNNSGDWLVNDMFNYGYPTLKYGHLKRSSYASATFTSEGSSGRDAQIQNGTYTRFANGITEGLDTENDYYMIPNAGVLAKKFSNYVEDEGASIGGGYALLYDIDWTKRTSASETFTGEIAFTGRFDGRGKTISGLNRRLFASVGSYLTSTSTTFVRNLRLIDANISYGGLLADTITNATISNMTLSGFINDSGDRTTTEFYYVGGLANEATWSQIDTITNLIDVKATYNGSQDWAFVGGVVGLANNTSIEYCANYGPVNFNNTKNGKSIGVGGICGYAIGGANSTISYSYNATSVVNNYATSTALSTTTGSFYTGGILGYGYGNAGQEVKITNCYNSGMIKSGNKNNNYESYAGGILGKDYQYSDIDTCYNEGNVEALAVNPQFEWKWENVSVDGKDVRALTLRQSSVRNVWAFGLGYLNGRSSVNSTIRMQESYDSETLYQDETVYNNGASLYKNTLVKYWKWSDIATDFIGGGEINDNGDYVVTNASVAEVDRMITEGNGSSTWDVQLHMYLKFEITYKTSKTPNVITTSIDERGLPTAFILQINPEITLYGPFARKAGTAVIHLANSENKTITQSKVIDSWSWRTGDEGEDIQKAYFDAYVSYYNGKKSSIACNSGNKVSQVLDTEGSSTILTYANLEVVENTRSQLIEENYTTINIGGVKYCLADQDSLSSALTQEEKSIILTEDIPLGIIKSEGGFNKSENVNLIGNGYYISYYGNSMFGDLAGENSFVRDVRFLGETNDSELLTYFRFDCDMNNIEIYGSVLNPGYGFIITYMNNNGNGSMSDVKTYACANVSRDSVLFGIKEISDTYNYGLITAKRGSNGTQKTINGASGCSIYASEDTGKGTSAGNITNYGILRAGDGGNGLGGKSSSHGTDLIFEEAEEHKYPNSNEYYYTWANTSSSVAGAGGNYGSAGTISGFINDEVSNVGQYTANYNFAQNGLKGSSGAKGRTGFGKTYFKDIGKGEFYYEFYYVNAKGEECALSPVLRRDSWGDVWYDDNGNMWTTYYYDWKIGNDKADSSAIYEAVFQGKSGENYTAEGRIPQSVWEINGIEN